MGLFGLNDSYASLVTTIRIPRSTEIEGEYNIPIRETPVLSTGTFKETVVAGSVGMSLLSRRSRFVSLKTMMGLELRYTKYQFDDSTVESTPTLGPTLSSGIVLNPGQLNEYLRWMSFSIIFNGSFHQDVIRPTLLYRNLALSYSNQKSDLFIGSVKVALNVNIPR